MVKPNEVASESEARAFAAWVIDTLQKYGEMPDVLAPLIAELGEMWRDSRIDDVALQEAKVVMWRFLEAKHGDSVTIADAEDRAVRAALTLAERPAARYDIDDCRDWVLEMLPGAAS